MAQFLAVRNLGRRHPTTSGWLFRQIEFEIKPGDRLALVGPTGSGKSLILRAVALLDPVDQGEISWCGQPVADPVVPEFRGHVLYLQQRSPLIEGTVEENLELPFTMHLRRHQTYPRHRAAELLANLGKDQTFLSSRTTNLSGGEQQIVALVRALLTDPTLLLLDEPSAALDPVTTTVLESLVESWHAAAASDRAYVWVSHDPAQAERIADRLIHLEEGRMVTSR